MDYGAPPKFMLMANPALVELWNKAKCGGVGYLLLPHFKSLFDVPCVVLLFADADNGCKLFDLFRSWDCEPDSGRGTEITFIEDVAAKSYTMTIGSNAGETINRLLDPSMLEDFSILTMSLIVRKTLPLSQYLGWLRQLSQTKPIVFAPASGPERILLDRGFVKSDVQFLDKGKIPSESIEYFMAADDAEHPMKPKDLPIRPAEIAMRRARQLKRFFAVTMARLEHNPAFKDCLQKLSGRYERWQVTQAACNLICGEWFPDSRGSDGRVDFHKAYDFLRHSFEVVIDALALEKPFTPEMLAAQIQEDMTYLCEQVRPHSEPPSAEAMLQKLGLVR